MTSRSDQPAFPAMHFDLTDNEHGMTLRDYFAAKALQGILAGSGNEEVFVEYDALARQVYGMADAMLKERDAQA